MKGTLRFLREKPRLCLFLFLFFYAAIAGIDGIALTGAEEANEKEMSAVGTPVGAGGTITIRLEVVAPEIEPEVHGA